MRNLAMLHDTLYVLRKTEELLVASSNRYRMTVQVANKAKRKKHENTNDLNLNDFKFKPVIRAILEIAEELQRLSFK